MERTSKILTSLFALRILQLMFSSVSVIPSFLATWWRRNTLFAKTILLFAQRLRRKRSFSSREKTPKAMAWERATRGWTTVVHVQSRRRGGSDWCAGQEAAREWWIETKRRLRNPVAVAVRDEGRSELRDPQALRVVIIINLSGV